MASAYASARRRVKLPAMRELAARAPQGPGRRVNRAVVLGLALAVVLGFGIYRVLSGSPRAAVAAGAGHHAAAGNHAAAGPDARPSTPDPAPKASHAAAAPATAPAMLAQAPAPAHAAAAGRGARAQSPAGRSDDQRSSPGRLRTGGYATARFGTPYPGTRLLLDMGRTVAVISMRINLGKVPGTGCQPRAGTKPALANTPPIAQAAGGKDLTAGTVTIELRRVTAIGRGPGGGEGIGGAIAERPGRRCRCPVQDRLAGSRAGGRQRRPAGSGQRKPGGGLPGRGSA